MDLRLYSHRGRDSHPRRAIGRPKRKSTCILAVEQLEDRRLLTGPNLVPSVGGFFIENRNFATQDDGSTLDGCCTAAPHKVLRFNFNDANRGDVDLVIGAPADHPEWFVFSPAHGHFHFADFNDYALLNRNGGEVLPGFKQAFCLEDVSRIDGPTTTRFTCGFQGVQRGWMDIYTSGLPCQFIVIDGLASGDYILRASTNIKRKLAESDYSDNSTYVGLRINTVANTVVQIPIPDVGDTLADAFITGVGPALDSMTINGKIGDGPFGNRDVDIYRFEAHRGSTVSLRTTLPPGGAAMDTMMRVFNSGGTEIAFNDDCNPGVDLYSCLTVPINSTGTYYVGISGFPNRSYNPSVGGSGVAGSTGDYRLKIQLNNRPDVGDTMDTAFNTGLGPTGSTSFVAPDQSIGWSLYGARDVAMYRFTANAGTTLAARTSIPLVAGASPMDTVVRLFDASGTQLAANDDDPGGGTLYSQLNFTFTTAGTNIYYLGVSAFPNFSYNPRFVASGTDAFPGRLGDYRLSLSLLDQADIGDTLAAALVTGMTPTLRFYEMPMENVGNGVFGSRDVDMYRFQGYAGERLTARTLQPAAGVPADTILRLFDSGGNQLAVNDDCTPGVDLYSCINNFLLAANDTYYVGISAFANFGYNPAVAGSGTPAGDNRPGDYRLFLTGAGADHFLISVPANVTSGTPFDITVTAIDPSGSVDSSFNGRITFSTSDPDPGIVLPDDYTFSVGVGGDNGVHTFVGQATLITTGPQTITSADTVSGISGSASLTVDPAAFGPASRGGRGLSKATAQGRLRAEMASILSSIGLPRDLGSLPQTDSLRPKGGTLTTGELILAAAPKAAEPPSYGLVSKAEVTDAVATFAVAPFQDLTLRDKAFIEWTE